MSPKPAPRASRLAGAHPARPQSAPPPAQPAPKPAKETTPTKAPEESPAAVEANSAPRPAARRPPPQVRTIATTDAKRVGLYLHPDDYRELALAKVDDGADLNARIKAMIALWRENERFRKAVDRLAVTAPRGSL